MRGEIVMNSMMLDFVSIGSDADNNTGGFIAIVIGGSTGRPHREDAHIIVIVVVVIIIHVVPRSRTPWRAGNHAKTRGFILPAERDGDVHIFVCAGTNAVDSSSAICSSGRPHPPLLLRLRLTLTFSFLLLFPGSDRPLPLRPQLLLLPLLPGPGNEPPQVLAALAAQDGVGPDDGRQHLLPPSVLHQLAGAVEDDVAGRDSRGVVGLGEEARHSFEVVPVGLPLPPDVLQFVLALPAAPPPAADLVGLHDRGALEGFVKAKDLGVVELELAGADLVPDAPFGGGDGARRVLLLGEVGGPGRVEGVAVEEVDEVLQDQGQLGVLVEADGDDGAPPGGRVGRADVGEGFGHFDEDVHVAIVREPDPDPVAVGEVPDDPGLEDAPRRSASSSSSSSGSSTGIAIASVTTASCGPCIVVMAVTTVVMPPPSALYRLLLSAECCACSTRSRPAAAVGVVV
mmetsp:Transcript_24777/g.71582  ORF Transcript_24777/g.71582 Transcript_24777/m.71582 type:complete len:456 (+) Transcript_24777:1103-2470(+)